MLGRNNRSEDVVSEIISFALGERFESIVRPDDPQNGFDTASTRNGHCTNGVLVIQVDRPIADPACTYPEIPATGRAKIVLEARDQIAGSMPSWRRVLATSVFRRTPLATPTRSGMKIGIAPQHALDTATHRHGDRGRNTHEPAPNVCRAPCSSGRAVSSAIYAPRPRPACQTTR